MYTRKHMDLVDIISKAWKVIYKGILFTRLPKRVMFMARIYHLSIFVCMYVCGYVIFYLSLLDRFVLLSTPSVDVDILIKD